MFRFSGPPGILIFSLIAAGTGCSNRDPVTIVDHRSDATTAAPAPIPVPPAKVTALHLKAELLSVNELDANNRYIPNNYKVRLWWKAQAGDTSSYVVSRDLSPTQGQALDISTEAHRDFVPLGSDENEMIDPHFPVGNALYSYTVKAIHNGEYAKGETVGNIEIKVPLDLEIKGQVDAAKADIDLDRKDANVLSRYRRIIFHENSALKTGFSDLIIYAEKILVDPGARAKIYNLENGSTAAEGQNGKSGGAILVHAISAMGHLNIISRGERGGHGIKGANGAAPDPTTNITLAGKNSLWQGGDEEFFGFNFCTWPATDGAPGGPGKNGAAGMDGMLGGPAGAVSIQIAQPSPEFIPAVSVIPGLGGVGGVGGDGGLGEEGGNPGDHTPPAWLGSPLNPIPDSGTLCTEGKLPVQIAGEKGHATFKPEFLGNKIKGLEKIDADQFIFFRRPQKGIRGTPGFPGQPGHDGLTGEQNTGCINIAGQETGC